MSAFVRDLQFAIRTLRRDWMITVIAVLSLGVAIGGNGAVFSLVDAFLFRPLPFEEADRVIVVGERQTDQPEFSGFLTTSVQTYVDIAERSRGVSEWAALRAQTMSLRGSDSAEPVSGTAVTPGLFRLLGASPARGRTFAPEEGVVGGPRAVILGHEFWLDRYGEEGDPLGDVLILNGEPHEVVGVARPNFGFLSPNQDVWTALQIGPSTGDRDQRNVIAVGRLAPNATMAAVRAQMRAVAGQLEEEYPDTQLNWTFDTYNMRHDIPLRQTRLLFGLLQGSVALVLLIACVNITNLLLARGQQRGREIALRTILGAHRGRIVRQLLTESGLLMTAGGVLAIGIAYTGIRLMSNQFATVLPPGYEVVMDGRVLGFTLLVSVAAGMIFGLVPALQTFKRGQSEALRDGDARGGSGKGRKRVSRALVVAEIALSFVALGGGALLVKSFLDIRASDPGFDAQSVLTALVTVPRAKYESEESAVQLRQQALELVRAVPMVTHAAFASALPQSPFVATDSFRVEGVAIDLLAPVPQSVVLQVSSEYLEAMGIDLMQGRFFDSRDRLDAPPVAVVNQSLARRRFSEGTVLGNQLEVRGEFRTIVGVAEDVQQVMFQVPGAQSGESIYLPVDQSPRGASRLVIRTTGDPKVLADQVRRAVQAQDPDLTLSQILTMEEFVDQFLVGIGVFNVVLGGFGMVALLLAALGTYGVLSYSVNQRRREIGIRMTVGAEPKVVVRMVARQGLVLAALGLGIGILLTVPLVGVMQNILQGVSTVQPQLLIGVGALLFVVTLVASLVPAARAAMVDPAFTLRDG